MQFCFFLLEQMQVIDNETKYSIINTIYNYITEENQKVFIQNAYKIASDDYKVLFIYFFVDFAAELPNSWDIASSLLLLKPNKNKYRNVSFIRLMDIDIPYVKNNISIFENKSLSLLVNSLYKAAYKKSRVYQTFVPSSYYNKFKNFVLLYIQNIDLDDFLSRNISKLDVITKIVELSKYIKNFDKQYIFAKYAKSIAENITTEITYLSNNDEEKLINSIILINSMDPNICSDFISNHIQNFNTYIKMKLWLVDLYDVFDYNNYGFYFFRLNKYEKKLYSQKAKALMKKEIQEIMIAERIPWEYQYTSKEGVNYYNASWRSIWFNNGGIKFCKAKVDGENIFSHSYKWDYAEEKFNFLYGYLSRKKIQDVIVEEQSEVIKTVKGLDILEEVIYKASLEKEIKENNRSAVIKDGEHVRFPPSLIIKNECINFLNEKQDVGKNPIRVLEISRYDNDNDNISVDISLLFTITRNNSVFVVWESLEFEKSKATHIFKMLVDEYEFVLNDIVKFLEENIRVRSILNSANFDIKGKLKYLGKVNHDNFDFGKWQRQLLSIIENRA
jgi:uncharacterized protein YlbG (UPF0298 family)